MRISDWSSDVCSSDLMIELERIAFHEAHLPLAEQCLRRRGDMNHARIGVPTVVDDLRVELEHRALRAFDQLHIPAAAVYANAGNRQRRVFLPCRLQDGLEKTDRAHV